MYKVNKREAYQALLSQVAAGMRSTLVTADSYDELKLIHTARRLYQRSGVPLTTKTRQDLARRFATAHHILKEKFPNEVRCLVARHVLLSHVVPTDEAVSM